MFFSTFGSTLKLYFKDNRSKYKFKYNIFYKNLSLSKNTLKIN